MGVGIHPASAKEHSSEDVGPTRDFSSPIGWMAVAAAASIFGMTEMPVKIPESQDIGPALFNAYTFLGNGLCHTVFLVMLLLHGQYFQWQWQAVCAAFDIMLVQSFARSAIWLLGISVGPPMWCVVGMATSFIWGTAAFGDKPGSWPLSLTGLALLMMGVVSVSIASVVSQAEMAQAAGSPKSARSPKIKKIAKTAGEAEALTPVVGRPQEDINVQVDAEQQREGATDDAANLKPVAAAVDSLGLDLSDDDLRPAPATASSTHLSNLLQGFGYAVAAGVADGSLVAFYQQMEESKLEKQKEDADPVSDMFHYLATFGATMLTISSLQLIFLHYRSGALQTIASMKAEWKVAKMVPGLVSGGMWAAANSCSVLGSHFLGMSLSFPLTQTASVICALLGLFVFNELQGTKARIIFGAALVVIVVGASILAYFGEPVDATA
eukprot:TRINITY_DN14979_c0_g1_i2.p1 TRINITY_DN14979_c0_g1~~TRINITY_DN14979_c0_g1_i2.p1  ORF type:complete len:438 (+),score=97.39 TRINITY_DN14979_c0_g1_i2:342-1655(+)